jgi:hypothetical protein
MARAGALARGVLLDRNLLARSAPLLDPGAVVADARPDVPEDPIRFRSVSGGARIVLARMRGHTAGLEWFETWAEARSPSQALSGLGGRVAPPEHVEPDPASRVLLGPSWSPLAADTDAGLEPEPIGGRRERTEPINGPGDVRCTECGGVVRAGQCSRCGRIP